MIRKYIAEEMIFEDAVKRAVEESIKRGILAEILRKNRSEVIDMILTEYNEEEFALSQEEAVKCLEKYQK